jgi:hypothetical protein
MDPAKYNYIVKLEGYEDYSGEIEINAGKICCLSVDLEKSEKQENCQTIATPCISVPQSIPGYTVIRERDLYGGLGMLVGVIIGAAIVYFLLRKR